MEEQRLILVVEDDDLTRAFLLDNLAADGFRVAGASGAGEALRAIEVRQPALVVLDLGLADGSGLGLVDTVRPADGLASRLDPDLPGLVLTGRSAPHALLVVRLPTGEARPRLPPSSRSRCLTLRSCCSSISRVSRSSTRTPGSLPQRLRSPKIGGLLLAEQTGDDRCGKPRVPARLVDGITFG